MESRVYIMKAGEFKLSMYGKEDKWSSNRWAKVVVDGRTHNFEEDEEEYPFRVQHGATFKYTSGLTLSYETIDVTKTGKIDFLEDGRLISF